MALTDYLNRRIRLAQARVEKEEKRLAAIVKEVQRTCKHEHVAEEAYYVGGDGYHPPRRICLQCGREESSSMWPSFYAEVWEPDTEKGYGIIRKRIKKTLLNNELVHKVQSVASYRP